MLDAGAETGAADVAAAWGERVTVVTARPTAFPRERVGALVRPDGHVGWIGHEGTDGLASALTTWLGTPA